VTRDPCRIEQLSDASNGMTLLAIEHGGELHVGSFAIGAGGELAGLRQRRLQFLDLGEQEPDILANRLQGIIDVGPPELSEEVAQSCSCQ